MLPHLRKEAHQHKSTSHACVMSQTHVTSFTVSGNHPDRSAFGRFPGLRVTARRRLPGTAPMLNGISSDIMALRSPDTVTGSHGTHTRFPFDRALGHAAPTAFDCSAGNSTTKTTLLQGISRTKLPKTAEFCRFQNIQRCVVIKAGRPRHGARPNARAFVLVFLGVYCRRKPGKIVIV